MVATAALATQQIANKLLHRSVCKYPQELEPSLKSGRSDAALADEAARGQAGPKLVVRAVVLALYIANGYQKRSVQLRLHYGTP